MKTRIPCVVSAVVASCLWLAASADGQVAAGPGDSRAENVIVPQARAFAVRPSATANITSVQVGVVVVEQVATTTMDIRLQNPGPRQIEAELVVPVPPGALVRAFVFEGSAAEPTAVLLPKDEARRTYDAIVAQARDPALLEFADCGLIRSCVFPIPSQGTQQVRLTYEHVLTRDGRRVDYELPRSELLGGSAPWNVSVKIESPRPIATVYSPSHALEVVRRGPNRVSARTTAGAATQPGPFRLSYVLGGEDVSATLLAYPDHEDGGGYFLLLAGLPGKPPSADTDTALRREVTLVLDHSGSMNGEKLEQARAAALQVVAGLDTGEAFNIIAYNDGVDAFASQALKKDSDTEQAARQFLARLRAEGGTNIHEALRQALAAPPTPQTLPLVLFLTDGLPTVGITSEVEIRKVATEHNPHRRRVFTFGVGADVNTPLLQEIARETRATTTFVLPQEGVEVKVAHVFKGLQGPILTDATLSVPVDLAGPPRARVADLLPARLPDFFADDQLIVLGRYAGDEPLEFELSGRYLDRERVFRFRFPLDRASRRNAFVPRLWASRRIAELSAAIRRMGADPGALTTAATDPRIRELTDEILRLSIQFGVLTEYTAFLAREGTDLSKPDAVRMQATANYQQRAMATRSGYGALNQGLNNEAQMAQKTLNYENTFVDENLDRVSIATIQQLNDRAYFRRGQRWIDSRVLPTADDRGPDRVVEFGSDEYRALVSRLTADHRHGVLALDGELLILVDGQRVLVKGPPSRE